MRYWFVCRTRREFLDVTGFKRAFVFLFLAALPLLLGSIMLPFYGLNLHLFQFAIFLNAALFGPLAGALTGALAGASPAFAMHNYWIIGGNALLGFFTAVFARRFRLPIAALLAFAVQLPYLYVTDLYAGLALAAVNAIALKLFVEDAATSLIAAAAQKTVRSVL